MKFTVNAAEMKAVVAFTQKAIASKNTLPIMDCVKLDQDENGNLTVTGGDTGIFLTLTIPMHDVQDFQPICMEAAMMSDALGTLGKQPVTFEVSGTSATLVYASGHLNFVAQPVDEYPTVEADIEAVDAFEMNATDLSRWIGVCRNYTIDDELHPVMGGVYLDMTGDHLVMAASDGHKMIRKSFPDIPTRKQLGSIVTGQTAALLSAYSRPVTMSVRLGNRQTAFIAEGFRLVATSIEGNYPRYNSVIPQNNPIRVEIDRATFSTALKRVQVMGDKATSLIKLTLSTYMGGDGQLSVQSQDLNFNKSGEETFGCTHNADKPMSIGFKGTFLQTLLATHTTSTIAFELADPSRAGVMRDTDGGDKDLLTLLMPMMLQD